MRRDPFGVDRGRIGATPHARRFILPHSPTRIYPFSSAGRPAPGEPGHSRSLPIAGVSYGAYHPAAEEATIDLSAARAIADRGDRQPTIRPAETFFRSVTDQFQ